MSSKRSNPKHRNKRDLGTFGSGHTVPLRFELLDSLAYRSLSYAEQAIFIDMYRAYCRLSRWDTCPLDDCGFEYSYSHCGTSVARKTFYDAMKKISEVGFISYAPHLQDLRPGSPKAWLPSTNWKHFAESESGVRENERLSKKAATKDAEIIAANDRRERHRRLGTHMKKK